MKKHFIFWILVFVYFSQINIYAQNSEFRIKILKNIVYTLTSDSMQNRANGTKGIENAKNFILSTYRDIGLSPYNGTYAHEFTYTKNENNTFQAYNVIGVIDNNADSTIIIAAHYDNKTPIVSKTSQVYSSEDESVSSIAVMLLLADQVKNSEVKKYNYLFIAFAAHEEELLGSKTFVAENNVEHVKLVIYFDMVGRLKQTYPQLNIMRNKMDNYLDSTLLNIEKRNFDINILKRICSGDVSAFDDKNVPYILLTSGTQSDYPTKFYTPDKINYLGMNDIVEYTLQFLEIMEQKKCFKSNEIIIE